MEVNFLKSEGGKVMEENKDGGQKLVCSHNDFCS